MSLADMVSQYDESGGTLSSKQTKQSDWFADISKSFSQSFNGVGIRDGLISGVQPDLESGESGESWASISRSERFKGFVLLLLMSGFFFTLSIMFIGFVAIFPAKFAFPFSMGSLSFMGAFAFMKGPANWVKSVFTKDQILFTVAYFGSIIGTLYACLVQRSYLLTLLFTAIQICALGQYAFGNLPGGQFGLRLIGNFIKHLFMSVCVPCWKGVFSLFTKSFS